MAIGMIIPPPPEPAALVRLYIARIAKQRINSFKVMGNWSLWTQIDATLFVDAVSSSDEACSLQVSYSNKQSVLD